MPASELDAVVADFHHRHRHVVDYGHQARERCAEISEAFVDACTAVGIPARVVSGIEYGQIPEFPDVTLILNGHYAAQVATAADPFDDLVYDWTARQFDPQAPVPLVQTLAEWRTRWTASPETSPALDPTGVTS